MAEKAEEDLESATLPRRFSPELLIAELGLGQKPRDVILGAAAVLAADVAPALL